MGSDILWVDVLGSKDAADRLNELERSNDIDGVKKFLHDEDWRLLQDTGLYSHKIPFWKILAAYELTFEQKKLFYDLIRELKIYKHDEVQLTSCEKEDFIQDIEKFNNAGLSSDFSDEQRSVIKYTFQRIMALILKSEVLKEDTLQILNKAGLVQKKAVHGLPMPTLVQAYGVLPFKLEQNTSTHVPEACMPPVNEGARADEEVSALCVPTREEALKAAGGWYALEPTNRALHVGLLLLQQTKTQEEIYEEVWGVKPVEGRAWRRSVQYQRDSFVQFAARHGLDVKEYVTGRAKAL